ncbi:methylmalonyl Co-A mutase-associated GTPase MeaB [Metallumcola ferriviriculae]|uniref:Methylmalonyl Co-A mutase-associated GTPase MeaB n=1 Tax=Metallumcola ferriviriculae TaxID=3039180 RepID=A0AAU0UK14_9FIRM|nr:methylmalonyl Co-A mutase-associated GTPase MeaB [Desulfitibacteraceae bacterium MK1]
MLIIEKFIGAFEQGDKVALGRLLKEVENQTPLGYEMLKQTISREGNSHIVGITGPPGAGKSTIITKLCQVLSKRGLNVGVVCIDPSSPFNGGALLGDRVRMQDAAKLPQVFIKSLATRGNLGGLAVSTADIVQVLDAFGKDLIIVETVGVGQVEFDVLDIADTVVLVTVPGLGDAIQTYKAGIMEIADLYVVNQADRGGADETARDLRMMVEESGKKDWQPPVIKTVAINRQGIEKLSEEIQRHRSYLLQAQLWQKKRRERNAKKLTRMLEALFNVKAAQYIESHREVEQLVERVREGNHDPYSAAIEILENMLKS